MSLFVTQSRGYRDPLTLDPITVPLTLDKKAPATGSSFHQLLRRFSLRSGLLAAVSSLLLVPSVTLPLSSLPPAVVVRSLQLDAAQTRFSDDAALLYAAFLAPMVCAR